MNSFGVSIETPTKRVRQRTWTYLNSNVVEMPHFEYFTSDKASDEGVFEFSHWGKLDRKPEDVFAAATCGKYKAVRLAIHFDTFNFNTILSLFIHAKNVCPLIFYDPSDNDQETIDIDPDIAERCVGIETLILDVQHAWYSYNCEDRFSIHDINNLGSFPNLKNLAFLNCNVCPEIGDGFPSLERMAIFPFYHENDDIDHKKPNDLSITNSYPYDISWLPTISRHEDTYSDVFALIERRPNIILPPWIRPSFGLATQTIDLTYSSWVVDIISLHSMYLWVA